MRPPIFVFEGWDLRLYDSVSDAELDLEVIDVENGLYKLYDSRGKKLKAKAEGQEVRIVDAGPDPESVDVLRDQLIDFLIRVGKRPGPEESLDQLIEMCSPYRFKAPRSNWDVLKSLFRRSPS